MTLEHIKSEREKLEAAIKSLVVEFEKSTETKVESIQLQTSIGFGRNTRIVQGVKVMLDF